MHVEERLGMYERWGPREGGTKKVRRVKTFREGTRERRKVPVVPMVHEGKLGGGMPRTFKATAKLITWGEYQNIRRGGIPQFGGRAILPNIYMQIRRGGEGGRG